jgi:hypothetical protein
LDYILQRVSPIFAPEIHENISAVTEHLEARGLRTLRLIPTRSGAPTTDLGDDGVWRLMTRLPGVSFDRIEDLDQARAAGVLVGSFHGALQDFEAPLQPLGFPLHDTPGHFDELQRALATHESHPRHPEVSRLSEEILRAAECWRPPPSLPRRVIHGDLKLNNLLFAGMGPDDRQRGVALIDLDTLSRLPLYFDWGDAWRSWCNRSPQDSPEAELDVAIFEAASEGLMGALGFAPDPGELESLTWGLELLSLELAARFAADSLLEQHFAWDAERFESAAEHNLSRARGQFSLHGQAVETHDRRARFLLG